MCKHSSIPRTTDTCIILYDARVLLRLYAMYFGSGNLLVLIIPGWDRGSCQLISLVSMSCTEVVNTVLNIVLLV